MVYTIIIYNSILSIYIYWALPRDTNSDHNSYHKKKHTKTRL